jgi:archaemetzincin
MTTRTPWREAAAPVGALLAVALMAGPARAEPIDPPTYYVRALGDVAPAHTDYACQVVHDVFHLRCRVLRPQPLPVTALDAERHQYDADRLDEVLFRDLPTDAMGLMAVTNGDLFEAGKSRFVFGEAHLVDHVGVVSLARYRNSWWGLADDEALFRSRFYKVLIHEVGHTLGVPHCPNRRCAMREDRTLADLDVSPEVFCDHCQEALKRGTEQVPGTAGWHYTRGHSHLARGQFAQAVLHFEKAVELAPRDARYRNDLGVALLREGEAAKALWYFREAARLDPTFPNARYNEGLVFLNVGDADMARHAFEDALTADPGWSLADRQLGYLYLQVLGDADQAYQHFGRYLADHDDDPSVREEMRLIKGGGPPATPP